MPTFLRQTSVRIAQAGHRRAGPVLSNARTGGDRVDVTQPEPNPGPWTVSLGEQQFSEWTRSSSTIRPLMTSARSMA